MDLYSVTTVMKEYDGYKNASFHWFYCDAPTISRPYADLIENYNGMNRLRAAYAEGYIDESFSLDEAQALKDYLDRSFGDKGIAKERCNFSAVAFELFLCSGRDDQIGYLRRQETAQSAHALDFAHLVGDTLFELLVQLVEIVEQPGIFDGDDSLRGKISN